MEWSFKWRPVLPSPSRRPDGSAKIEDGPARTRFTCDLCPPSCWAASSSPTTSSKRSSGDSGSPSIAKRWGRSISARRILRPSARPRRSPRSYRPETRKRSAGPPAPSWRRRRGTKCRRSRVSNGARPRLSLRNFCSLRHFPAGQYGRACLAPPPADLRAAIERTHLVGVERHVVKANFVHHPLEETPPHPFEPSHLQLPSRGLERTSGLDLRLL